MRIIIENADNDDFNELAKLAREGKIHTFCMTDEEEWIPVSERLPDKNMLCLVSVGKFNYTQIAIYSDLMETIDHKIFYQGDYGKNNFQNITEYVNAWMPLPKSYKGDKEE